jgi:dipeptidase E
MHCILASTSTVHGSGYLEYLQPQLEELYDGIDEVLFIPYARPSGISHEQYTQLAQDGLRTINIKLKGIHHFDNPREAVRNAEAFFVGGGNTFLLVKTLQELNLMSLLKDKIIQGAPYLGTSAGTNIAGVNMQTTNDMPIVMPPSFETMGVLPFNINAHYIEPDPKSTHKGETRRTRIKEFQKFNDLNVLGLKEGSWLEVKDHTITLKGDLEAVWFQPGIEPEILQATHVF